MKCPKCKMVEMTVDSVNGNKVKHYCRNCGSEEITEITEITESREEI